MNKYKFVKGKIMKTYVKRNPFPEGITEEEDCVSLVLSEQETYWAYAEDNVCYPYMHGLIDKKIDEVKDRYDKPVKVYDINGAVIKEV